MCTFLLQNGALWDMPQMHSGICEMGLLELIISGKLFSAIRVMSFGCDGISIQWQVSCFQQLVQANNEENTKVPNSLLSQVDPSHKMPVI